MSYYVYLVECADKTLYCGYTNDLEKRVNAHNTSNTGAKYTKTRRPVKLMHSEQYNSLSEALKRERQIKSLNREQKISIISKYFNGI